MTAALAQPEDDKRVDGGGLASGRLRKAAAPDGVKSPRVQICDSLGRGHERWKRHD